MRNNHEFGVIFQVMKVRWKSKIALLMAFIMLFSAAAVYAYTDSPYSQHLESIGDGLHITGHENSYLPQPESVTPAALKVSDSIIFNLGNREVTIGQYTTADYQVNADNSITILLEDDAFFPYEVQFQWNGATTVEWFRTPESVVEIGGTLFRVHSAVTDTSRLTQIGIWINEEIYVAAYPEPKEFTNYLFSPFSLLPLDEFRVTLNLNTLNPPLLPPEYRMVRFQTVFSGSPTPSGPAADGAAQDAQSASYVAWVRRFGPTPTLPPGASTTVGQETTAWSVASSARGIDLLRDSITGLGGGFIEMIAGDANQLNMDNVRFFIQVSVPGLNADWLTWQVATTDRQVINTTAANSTVGMALGERGFLLTVPATQLAAGSDFYLGLNWGPAVTSALSGRIIDVQIYQGAWDTPQQAEAAPNITSRIWNQNLANPNAGLLNAAGWMNFPHNQAPVMFTMVLRENGNIIGFLPFGIRISNAGTPFTGFPSQTQAVRHVPGVNNGDIITTNAPSSIIIGGVPTFTFTLTGVDANADHRLRMIFQFNGLLAFDGSPGIERVVRGLYTTAQQVRDSAPENTVTGLFSNVFTSTIGGYTANFSQGVDFTLLDGNGVVRPFRVIFQSAASNIGLSGVRDGVSGNHISASYSVSTPVNGVRTITINMFGADATREHHVHLGYHFRNSTTLSFYGAVNSPVVRVVTGHHNTPEEVNSLPTTYDANELFTSAFASPAQGFLADFGGAGRQFTLLNTSNEVHRIIVRTVNPLPSQYVFNSARYGEERELVISSGGFTEYENGIFNIVGFVSTSVTGVNQNHYLRLGHQQFELAVNFFGQPGNPIQHVIPGHALNTPEEILAQPNIANQLFSPTFTDTEGGFLANFGGNGQNFTVLTTDNQIHRLNVRLLPFTADDSRPPDRLSEDTFFHVYGAAGVDPSLVYVMPFQHDTYYMMGFQTAFFIDDPTVDLSEIRPTFRVNDPNVNIWAGHAGRAGGAASLQQSGVTVQDFTQGPVQYSAAAQDGFSLRNYWVTFVQRQAGPHLFVNGINAPNPNVLPPRGQRPGDPVSNYRREVFFDSVFGQHHDIFFANTGTQTIENLRVTLRPGAQYIQLDEYWQINGNLLPFDTAERVPHLLLGELQNVAKVRVVPTPGADGVISGWLDITGDNINNMSIYLTGIAGNPTIVTEFLDDAVRFVPYGMLIQHNNRHPWNRVTWSLPNAEWATIAISPDRILSGWTNDDLPPGFILRPNGEIYGMPLHTGTFEFDVIMNNSHAAFPNVRKTFELNLLMNTNANVEAQTDAGYELVDRIQNINLLAGAPTAQTMRSLGGFNEFMDVWLNGVRLVPGIDYDADDGSIAITLRAQTFDGLQPGTHTIAAEFRVDGNENNELRRAAQNFEITRGGTGGGGQVNDDSSSDDRDRDPGREPRPRPSPTPRPTPTPAPTPAPVVPDFTFTLFNDAPSITPPAWVNVVPAGRPIGVASITIQAGEVPDGTFAVSISGLPDGMYAPDMVDVINGAFNIELLLTDLLQEGVYDLVFSLYDEEGNEIFVSEAFVFAINESVPVPVDTPTTPEPGSALTPGNITARPRNFQQGTSYTLSDGSVRAAPVFVLLPNPQPGLPNAGTSWIDARVVADVIGLPWGPGYSGWNGDTRTATFSDGTNIVSFSLDNPTVAVVNGSTVPITASGLPADVRILDGGRLFVPIAFFRYLPFNVDISWNAADSSVSVIPR